MSVRWYLFEGTKHEYGRVELFQADRVSPKLVVRLRYEVRKLHPKNGTTRDTFPFQGLLASNEVTLELIYVKVRLDPCVPMHWIGCTLRFFYQ